MFCKGRFLWVFKTTVQCIWVPAETEHSTAVHKHRKLPGCKALSWHEACGVFQPSLTQNTQRSPSGSWNCITLITAHEPETESRSGDGTPSHVQGSVHCRDSKQDGISPLPSRKLLDCSSGLCALHLACGCHFSKNQKGSPMSRVCAQLLSHNSETPWTVARLLCSWNSPGQNTGMGHHFLLQGIFLTQGWNLGLLHCRRILYHWATREAHLPLDYTFSFWQQGPHEPSNVTLQKGKSQKCLCDETERQKHKISLWWGKDYEKPGGKWLSTWREEKRNNSGLGWSGTQDPVEVLHALNFPSSFYKILEMT